LAGGPLRDRALANAIPPRHYLVVEAIEQVLLALEIAAVELEQGLYVRAA